MAEETRAQSEFNMAVSYLNRLNALFYAADEAAISLDVYTWFHSLLAIYRELSTEMKPTEAEDFDARIMRINPQLNLSLNQQLQGRGETSTELYQELHTFEIKLRKILKSSGLQMKQQEDALKALR